MITPPGHRPSWIGAHEDSPDWTMQGALQQGPFTDARATPGARPFADGVRDGGLEEAAHLGPERIVCGIGIWRHGNAPAASTRLLPAISRRTPPAIKARGTRRGKHHVCDFACARWRATRTVRREKPRMELRRLHLHARPLRKFEMPAAQGWRPDAARRFGLHAGR